MATALGLAANYNVLLVAGEWVGPKGRQSIDDQNPATGVILTRVPKATEGDVERAFAAAAEAQRDWARRPPQVRARLVARAREILLKQQDEIVELLVDESGSTRIKATFETGHLAANLMEEAAGLPFRSQGTTPPSLVPGKENRVLREPVGVVAVISPWTFPLHLSLRAVAPALALGNAVVLEPASDTPISGGLLLGRLFEAAGLPKGLLSVLPGAGPDVGQKVAAHPRAAVVAFTGSTAVGRKVAAVAAGHLGQPVLALGGNDPHVVLEDADLDRAVDTAVFGSFMHQGQVSLSINRHLVHRSLYPDYVRRLAERARALPMGDPRQQRTVIGPIINAAQRDHVMDLIRRSVEAGAKVEAGGRHRDLFVEATVLSGVTMEMPAAAEAHFGPVAPVLVFESDEEAVALANATGYGLAASVHGRDLARAQRVALAIEAGMVHVNDQPLNDEPHVPFGGMKASGMGRYNGEAILRALTRERWLSIQHEPVSYPFR